MESLHLSQSWWGMAGLPMNDEPWSPEERFTRIAEAGFQSVHNGARDKKSAQFFARNLANNGLSYIRNAVVEPDADIDAISEIQAVAGTTLINYQLSPAFMPLSWNIRRVEQAVEAARQHGLTPVFETHRGRITQDPLRAMKLMAALPEIRFTIDLSHWMVGGEWALHDVQLQQVIDHVIERAGLIHGRVSNGHQVQIDIGPDGDNPWANPFKEWWTRVFRIAQKTPERSVPFVCELGPPPYAMVDLDGKEISDRWQQANVLARVAHSCWEAAHE